MLGHRVIITTDDLFVLWPLFLFFNWCAWPIYKKLWREAFPK